MQEKGTVWLSVVIPVYNEEANLHTLFGRLMPVLDGLGRSYEVIFTNDGSRDRSIEILRELQQQRPKEVRVIDFNRNYGQHMAIMAGFEKSRGQVIVTLDADLQNPPEEIPKLIALVDQGHDVVGGCRKDRQDSSWRLAVSRLSNIVRERTTGIRMKDHGCMLRAYSRQVIDQVLASDEASTFIPALALLYAGNPAEVEVEHAPRSAGVSNYNFYKLIRYNFDLLTGFTLAPLQMFTIFGMCVSFLSTLLVIYIIARRLAIGPESDGLFTLFAIAFFLMGVIITGLGIIGEYIGRIYQEVRRRPRFVIKAMYE